MSLREQILKVDFMKAMKEKNGVLKLVLAELKGAIKNKEIDVKRELNDQEIVAIVKKAYKELNESIDGYTQAGNENMVTDLKLREEYFQSYLPTQISNENLQAIVRDQISQIGEVTMKDMGRVMGLCKSELATLELDFDGKILSELVKSEIMS